MEISILFKGKRIKLKKKDLEMKVLNLKKKKIDSISNLAGFEEFSDLEALILDNNRLTEIEMILNLTNLKYLSLKKNRIHNIKSLEGLPNLIELDLTGNEIINISGLEHLPNLQVLRLGNNKILEINNLEYLHNLEVLILENNHITEIKNLEKLNNLTCLNLNDNEITEVKNLDDLRVLRRIYLKKNLIIKIFPIHLQNLDEFDISWNPFYFYLKTRFEDINPRIIVEYSIDPEGLERRLMVGIRNIHVPINASHLTSILPSNDNILYSTLCKARTILTGGGGVGVPRTTYRSDWVAHVLITESGIGLTKPRGRGGIEQLFFKWKDISDVKARQLEGDTAVSLLPRVSTYLLRLTYIEDFESYQAFKNRLHYFPELCVALWKWSKRNAGYWPENPKRFWDHW